MLNRKSTLIIAVLLPFTFDSHAAPISGQGSWETTLFARDLDGNTQTIEAYYDALLDVTWLADALYAGGEMNWDDTINWVNGVNIGGYTNWRLPTLTPVDGNTFNYATSNIGTTDRGYNISAPGTAYAGTTASELAHMFFVTLGNKAFCDPQTSTATSCSGSQAGYGLTNTGPFVNLYTYHYWNGLEFGDDPAYAWDFNFTYGYQYNYHKSFNHYAWILHSGDIGTGIPTNVPLPSAIWLFLTGLVGLLKATYKQQSCGK